MRAEAVCWPQTSVVDESAPYGFWHSLGVLGIQLDTRSRIRSCSHYRVSSQACSSCRAGHPTHSRASRHAGLCRPAACASSKPPSSPGTRVANLHPPGGGRRFKLPAPRPARCSRQATRPASGAAAARRRMVAGRRRATCTGARSPAPPDSRSSCQRVSRRHNGRAAESPSAQLSEQSKAAVARGATSLRCSGTGTSQSSLATCHMT
jgi:hypothetical protein